MAAAGRQYEFKQMGRPRCVIAPDSKLTTGSSMTEPSSRTKPVHINFWRRPKPPARLSGETQERPLPMLGAIPGESSHLSLTISMALSAFLLPEPSEPTRPRRHRERETIIPQRNSFALAPELSWIWLAKALTLAEAQHAVSSEKRFPTCCLDGAKNLTGFYRRNDFQAAKVVGDRRGILPCRVNYQSGACPRG